MNSQSNSEIAGIMHSYLKRLKEDRDKLNAEIGLVEAKLVGLNNTPEVNQHINIHRRRPRGANLEAVRKTLTDKPTKQYTVADLKHAIGISASSVRTALDKLKVENAAQEVSKGYWKAVSPM